MLWSSSYSTAGSKYTSRKRKRKDSRLSKKSKRSKQEQDVTLKETVTLKDVTLKEIVSDEHPVPSSVVEVYPKILYSYIKVSLSEQKKIWGGEKSG